MKTAEDAKDAEESMVAFSTYWASLRFWSGPERVLRKTESTAGHFRYFPPNLRVPCVFCRFKTKAAENSAA